MNLGSTIKELRKVKGIKQIDLANLCEITPSYLSNIESNRKEPTITTLENISSNLKVPLPVLFFLSMDEEDVSENKKELFKMICPILKNSIREAFL